MPSPFPGMDPWLEAPGPFPDFHSRFLAALRAHLNARLPPPYYTAISTRVYMEDSDRRVEPDVDVLAGSNPDAIGSGGGMATLTAPWVGVVEVPSRPLPSEEITETFIEVRTAQEKDQLVTSIEMLSPTNKTRGTSGRGLYLAKQLELTSSGVNLVEFDFLRRGSHATAVPPGSLRKLAGKFDYHVSISRTDRDDAFFAIPIVMSQRLPEVPIPLLEGTEPVRADIQDVMDRTYDEGLYSRRLHYTQACDPPLTAEQQTWAEGILREKGLLK